MKVEEIFLLQAMDEAELEEIRGLGCMKIRTYQKDQTVFRMGDRVCELGVVLSGSVTIEATDLWGSRSIFSRVEKGQAFAETYALCREPMMVDAVCSEDAEILFLHVSGLLREENQPASWYPKLLRNILMLCARKNRVLSNRMFCTASKKIRSRILAFLSLQAVRNGSEEFTIPYNRQELADYLNLDRSAVSKELCRMRDEGILAFRKNQFHLFQTAEEEP